MRHTLLLQEKLRLQKITDKKLAFKNNAPFISWISKIDLMIFEIAEDLEIAMTMYNLLECSRNCRKTKGNLWNYYRDEPNSGAKGNINYSIRHSEYLYYKTSITGQLENNDAEKDDVKIVVPLKYLSNFWRTLDIPLINCEIFLNLTWPKNCVLTSKATREPDPDANPAVAGINNPTDAILK